MLYGIRKDGDSAAAIGSLDLIAAGQKGWGSDDFRAAELTVSDPKALFEVEFDHEGAIFERFRGAPLILGCQRTTHIATVSARR